MAVGTYNLPICDGCKLPWLPVGWTQDSDPRNPDKPLRCGKCKATGWDREFVKQQKQEVSGGDSSDGGAPGNAMDSSKSPASEVAGSSPALRSKTRCAHRMTDCPICHPKEAA